MFLKKITLIWLSLNFFHSALAFDPEEIAKTELRVWRAYYAPDLKSALPYLKELIEQSSDEALSMYLEALMMFKQKQFNVKLQDYNEEILSLVQRSLQIYSVKNGMKINTRKAAEKEFEYWVALRDSIKSHPLTISSIMAETYALVYGGDQESYRRAAILRTYAACYHDQCQDKFPDGLKETDWHTIQLLLVRSYQELKKALNKLN